MKENKNIIKEDFRPINLLSIAGALMMFGVAYWNIVYKPNDWWLGFAIGDIIIGFINIGALIFSLHTTRKIRLITAEIQKSQDAIDKIMGESK